MRSRKRGIQPLVCETLRRVTKDHGIWLLLVEARELPVKIGVHK